MTPSVRGLIGALVLLAIPLSVGAVDPPSIELEILGHPKEVPASSSFYVQVKLTNAGTVPVRGCTIELGQVVSPDPCLALGYRFFKAPRRLDVASVDTVQVLSRREVLAPGQSIERSVRLVSSRQSATGQVHLYAISGQPGALVWSHEAFTIVVAEASYEAKRRAMTTLALFAIYVAGVGWALVRIAKAILPVARRACSS